MKHRLATLFSWALTLSSAIFPSQSYAVAVADRMAKDENPTKNEQKEIRWTKSLSKSYAKALISAQYENWSNSEYKALLKLWGKESNWDHTADNPKSSAFGIPQLMGLKPSTPAPEQIARGLAYIQHRYGKPSIAWAHWRRYGWY
ncbi:hypothetical protein EB001_01390 [bacterium]|jgi:hypothetical protein|nr:hypothetical protein [bacterium]